MDRSAQKRALAYYTCNVHVHRAGHKAWQVWLKLQPSPPCCIQHEQECCDSKTAHVGRMHAAANWPCLISDLMTPTSRLPVTGATIIDRLAPAAGCEGTATAWPYIRKQNKSTECWNIPETPWNVNAQIRGHKFKVSLDCHCSMKCNKYLICGKVDFIWNTRKGQEWMETNIIFSRDVHWS